MAILRAGPFATSADSFIDEPEATGLFSASPVNCAMKHWVVDSWRARKSIAYILIFDPDDVTVTYEDGPNLGASFAENFGALVSEAKINFMYQAVEDTTFSVTYEVASGTDPEFNVDVGGSRVFTDSGLSSISGTETITLPATVVPSEVTVVVWTFFGGTGSISIAP